MNLIIDIGNTLVKMALMEHNQTIKHHTHPTLDHDVLSQFVADNAPQLAIISSTRGECSAEAEVVSKVVKDLIVFDSSTPIPITNGYATPSTLGRDRLAAAVEVAACHPQRNAVVIDFGTAITIDLVDDKGCFRGGSISPGVSSRLSSLYDYTATLPLLEPQSIDFEVARTTKDAILQGVMNGVKFEVEGFINQISEENDNLVIIFTGGEAKYFDKRIKNAIFADYNLVLNGLNRILEYNASEQTTN